MSAPRTSAASDGGDTYDGSASTVTPIQPAGLGRATQVSIVILAVIALLWVMQEARLFLMPTVLGALVALAAAPLCAAIERTGLPAGAAAMLVTASIVVGIGTVGWYMLPSVDEWRYRAPEVAITLERKLRRLESKVEEVTKTAASVAPDMGDSAGAAMGGASSAGEAESGEGDADEAAKEEEPKGPAEQIVEGGRRMVVNIIAAAPEIVGALIYGFFVTYFLLAERSRVRRWAMKAATSRRQAARLGRTLNEIRHTVGLYLATVSIINILLGLATGAAFWLIDMPAPVLWGAFMTLMNFMPYVGPLIVQICAFGVGFVTYDTTLEAFYPVAILIVFNTIEGQLLTPTVLGRRLSASPLAVFLAVTFGAWMWGAVGAIVATPALIVGSNFASLWAKEAQRQHRLDLAAQEAAAAEAERQRESRAAEEAADTGASPQATG